MLGTRRIYDATGENDAGTVVNLLELTSKDPAILAIYIKPFTLIAGTIRVQIDFTIAGNPLAWPPYEIEQTHAGGNTAKVVYFHLHRLTQNIRVRVTDVINAGDLVQVEVLE